MKHAFVPLIFAATIALAACATSGEMASAPPSQMSVEQINAEIAALSAEASALYDGSSRRIPMPLADTRPVRVTYVDSAGVVTTNYSPGDTDRYAYRTFSSGSSRPFHYARLEVLAKRRAELHAELRQRGVVQR